jgi:hypothetical protein
MIRTLLTGVAAVTLAASAASAQDVTVHAHPNPAVHIVRGTAIGVGVGAAIGCLVTLPVCGPGAAVGAAIGGGTGMVVGAARTPTHDYYYHTSRNDYPPAN